MTALLVQDYLRSGRTLAELYEDHAVIAKPHHGKVSFLYDQFRARLDDPLASQCRGLILREGTWDVVAYPFDRFFDHDHAQAAKVDWVSAVFEEKLDGTLAIVYFDEQAERWHVGTRQTPEGHGTLHEHPITVAELVNLAVGDMGVGAPDLHSLMEGIAADGQYSYSFELTAPENRVVCQYERRELTLIGVRRLSDFRELDPVACARALGLAEAARHPCSSLEEALALGQDRSPASHEGVIVKDSSFRRVKVKTPQYLRVHHAVDSLGASWRAVAEAILTDNAQELARLVPPRIERRIVHLWPAINELTLLVARDFQELQHIEDMKAFAEAAKQRLWPAPLFALKRGQTASVLEFLRTAKPDTVLELCRQRGWTELA